ncbi:CLUMA_CG008702, isoform A, partial [Clunio marinus]
FPNVKAPPTQEFCCKNILTIVEKLKLEVDNTFKNFKSTCSLKGESRDEVERIIGEFLRNNITELKTNQKDNKKNIFERIKDNISSLIFKNKTKTHSDVKRTTDLNAYWDDSDSTDEDRFNEFVGKLEECIKEQEDQSTTEIPTTTRNSYIEEKNSTNQSQNRSNFDAFIRHLANSKHPVKDAGRPIHKPPNLQKVQTLVDKVKNFDFFNLDDAIETTTPCVDTENLRIPIIFDRVELKRKGRNVFNDFTKKLKQIKGNFRVDKTKRTLNGIFDDVVVQEETSEAPEGEIKPQELQSQPTEDEKFLAELTTFDSQLNGDQRMAISDFLDHKLESLNHQNIEQTGKQDDEMTGAKKFFDFDSPLVKRSLFKIDEYNNIAKIKSKLIAQSRSRHPMIDYSAILREVEARKEHQSEKVDDFLDHFYRLNDGSFHVDDALKPYRSDLDVMSPYELQLKFQLDKEFKELDNNELKIQKSELPLLKPEIDSVLEDDESLP